MNEITRIHIAKVAYDIEVGAKKELEKYIKSLETYTQDKEVLADIEIRITELLAERGVAAGGVIGSDDIAAIRKQLGEPYEFADEDGDIAVGASRENDESRRLYRSLDDAVLGGVLSGIAAYFKVNPLWTRLIFILITFISFGLAVVLYIILWIIIPAARTAAEKLQLSGKPVTLESIRELNILEEDSRSRSLAPFVQRGIVIGLGIISILAAITTLIIAAWGIVAVFAQDHVVGLAESFLHTGVQYAWMPWLLFWIVLAGMLLLVALFSIIAYALLAKKITKKLIITGIVIIGLGIVSVASVTVIAATQSWRVADQAQSALRTSKINLPRDFSSVQSVILDNPTSLNDSNYSSPFSSIQYIVDEGTPRYELTALPTAKVEIKIEGQTAHFALDIPDDYRNAYVSPTLIIYGPALSSLEANSVQALYSNTASQDSFKIMLSGHNSTVIVNDSTFQSLVVEGNGTATLSSSVIQSLDVQAQQSLSVTAGTVRDLTATQPDACASSSYGSNTIVSVSGVTSGTMTYNGKQIPATTYRSNCASVIVGDDSADN